MYVISNVFVFVVFCSIVNSVSALTKKNYSDQTENELLTKSILPPGNKNWNICCGIIFSLILSRL